MSLISPRACRALLAVLLAALLPVALATVPAAADVPGGSVVSDNPANITPHVLDGRVYSIVQVGTTMVLGGTFSRARNEGSSAELTRNRLMAFDANTGQIRTGFAPNVNGTVRVVIPAGDGSTVYVGGSFTSINGQNTDSLARVRLSDGAVVGTFSPGSITGQVRDLRLSDGRLWVGGAFTHIGGTARPALATLNPQTGALTNYMTMNIEGNQNGGVTQVLKIDISPNGNRLVAVGNFRTVDGVENRQLVQLDTSGASATFSPFRTEFFTSTCAGAFDSYMRDVDFAPSGDFFVVTTTGAYRGSTSACDTSSRFETDGVGPNVEPSWVDYTGGDTTYGVEVTPGAVYVGGHFRWQNNAYAGDRPGSGSVSREGIAALDPANGLPLSWNPGRTKGVGVFDFLYTDQGLWAVSDTDRIGAYEYHGRVALLPSAGGSTYPSQPTPQLPGTVYLGRGSGLDASRLDSGGASPATDAPDGPQDWANAKGAFMLNGEVYLARSDGSFVRHAFDGATWGPAVPIETGDQNVAMADWDADVQAMTGMFLDDGRIYYTLQGQDRLFYRYFTAESGVVGAKQLRAAYGPDLGGIDFQGMRGMFLAGNRMYFADAVGNLRSLAWQRGPAHGAPVAGSGNLEQTPAPVSWTSNAMFLGPDNASNNAPPTARLSVSCADLTCTFDGSASTDSDGTVDGFAWDFGDGGSDSGDVVEHTYAAAGAKNVSLTVTDNGGKTGSAMGTANPTEPVTGGGTTVSLVGVAGYADRGYTHQVSVPSSVQAGDTLLLHATVNSTAGTLGNPGAGWTVLDSVSGTNIRGRSWTRTATASDAGSTVQVSTSEVLKVDLSLGSYRGDGGSLAVLGHAGKIEEDVSSTRTSPTVNNPTGGSWLVTSWVAKKSAELSWTLPASQTRRVDGAGIGGGRLTGVMSDSNGPVGTGQVGGLVGTTSENTSRVVMFSTVLGPDGGTTPPPANQAPTARLSVSCADLTCTFDGSASTDSDGTVDGFAWDFGDGGSDSGDVVEHTYAAAGAKNVSLTVTDNGGKTGSAMGTANPTEPVTGGGTTVSLVGVAGYADRGYTHQVSVPSSVQAGDTLLLHATVNSTAGTLGNPGAGWTVLDSVSGTNIRGRSWTRTATASDAGSTVQVSTSEVLKVDLSLGSYRGDGGSLAVLGHAGKIEEDVSSTRTSPTVNNPTGGSWLVTSWVAKKSAELSWTLPASQTRRVDGAGIGGGRLTGVMSDSNGPVGTGQVGGLVGTTSENTSRVVMFSTVLGRV